MRMRRTTVVSRKAKNFHSASRAPLYNYSRIGSLRRVARDAEMDVTIARAIDVAEPNMLMLRAHFSRMYCNLTPQLCTD